MSLGDCDQEDLGLSDEDFAVLVASLEHGEEDEGAPTIEDK